MLLSQGCVSQISLNGVAPTKQKLGVGRVSSSFKPLLIMWCLFIFTNCLKIPPALIITHPLFFCIESKCALNDGANEHSDNSNLQSVCQKFVQPAIKVLWNSFAVTFEQRTKRLLFKFEFEMSWTDWPTATLFLWHNKQEEVFIKASKRQRPLSLGAFSISHVARISKQG